MRISKSQTVALWFAAVYWMFCRMNCMCLRQIAARSDGRVVHQTNICSKLQPLSEFASAGMCPLDILAMKDAVYLLYDVNASEGFNLRRDVYVRLSVLVRKLRRKPGFANVRLVLPPWPHLYHWRTRNIVQTNQPWRQFFDMDSMQRYAPVMDFDDFLTECVKLGKVAGAKVIIDQVYRLQHFEDMFESGVFREKFEVSKEPCQLQTTAAGMLLHQPKLRSLRRSCVRFQGTASLLGKLLQQELRRTPALYQTGDVRIYAVVGAETVLHDHWGGKEFWTARRSMRFTGRLVSIADDYRRSNLDSFDGNVQRPIRWENERPHRTASGGNYLAVHLRRGDFVAGRQQTTPSMGSAASQIKQRLMTLNLTTVFVATDATAYELMNLRRSMPRHRVVHYAPEFDQQLGEIKDGGVAIIDQLICAHARHFIGTYESTFTYRIYEEREILGFPQNNTFNTFCKDHDHNTSSSDCPRNSIWSIVF